MPLRPYQDQGIDFLAARGNAILADEPGLGKSAQAIIAAEKIGASDILIVCPAIGRVSWPIELAKWDLTEREIVQYPTQNGVTGPIGTSFVYIVTYDLLSRGGDKVDWLVHLAKQRVFDLLILDEGQYCKDTSAKRTKLVYGPGGLVENIPTVWVLSGTITPNHNGELYPHVSGLFPDILAKLVPTGRRVSRVEFEDEFCKIRFSTFGNGRQITGNRNTDLLRKALAPVLLRRRAEELYAELPPLTIEEVEFDADAIGTLLSPTQVAALADAVAGFDHEMKQHDAYNESLTSAPTVALSTARRALGLAKVPLAAAWVTDLLTNGQDKIIVFAHHKDVIASLTAALLDYAPVTITGATTVKDRVDRVRAFQDDPTVRVLVGNIQAAGTSITLTASNRVVLVEPSWVPGDNTQAIRRSYRMGQKRPVVATYLSVKSSLDANINRTLARKSRDISQLLDDEQEKETA